MVSIRSWRRLTLRGSTTSWPGPPPRHWSSREAAPLPTAGRAASRARPVTAGAGVDPGHRLSDRGLPRARCVRPESSSGIPDLGGPRTADRGYLQPDPIRPDVRGAPWSPSGRAGAAAVRVGALRRELFRDGYRFAPEEPVRRRRQTVSTRSSKLCTGTGSILDAWDRFKVL